MNRYFVQAKPELLGVYIVRPWVEPLRFDPEVGLEGAQHVLLHEPPQRRPSGHAAQPERAPACRDHRLDVLWYAHGARDRSAYYVVGIFYAAADRRVEAALALYGLASRLFERLADAARTVPGCELCASAPGFCPRHSQAPVVAGRKVVPG